MTPPTIANIRGGSGEFRLELKGFPGSNSVTGKSDGISVAAGTSITRKDQWVLSNFCVVQEMKVIEQPQRIHAFHLGVRTLLPVNPPKVASYFLQWPMHNVKEGVKKCLVGGIE
ncbi:hypothetical protein ABW19_dt0203093 [Dactylella cylindrospora]|nr:hypothetical protein ABW19_dt0203093 [Dactylella cylindrospora]